jgi:uncharacterized protein YcaQ
VLKVMNVYAEDGAPPAAGPAVGKAIADLARWLGARGVDYGRLPTIWSRDLA